MKINLERAYEKYAQDLSAIIKEIESKDHLNQLLQSVIQLEEEPKDEILSTTK